MRKNLNGLSNMADVPYTKEVSLYYELLVKQYGPKFADRCWQNRIKLERMREVDTSDDAFIEIYKKVKNYKPRDPLCLIGDLNWGYHTIYANNKSKKGI